MNVVTKKELRTEIRNRINSLSDGYKRDSSMKIARSLIDSPDFLQAESIFCYVSTADEPDTSFIIETALKLGKHVFVPVCISKGIMIPVRITADTVFGEGYMGISEPLNYDKTENTKHFDLSVIPCITANFSGERLGHGAGFYDRFLCNKTTEKFCLCFFQLISPEIPTDENDIIMDAVVTEEGIVKI